MQSEEYQAAREAAMKLTEDERAFLADELYRSLDDATQDQIHDEWAAEISRRLAQIDRGEAEFVDGEAVLRDLEEDLNK